MASDVEVLRWSMWSTEPTTSPHPDPLSGERPSVERWRAALSAALSAMERVEALEKSASQSDRELLDASAKTWRRYQALEAAFPLMKEALEAVDGDVPAVDGYLHHIETVEISSSSLLKVEAALDAARKVTT
jgi:hypothetical protein